VVLGLAVALGFAVDFGLAAVLFELIAAFGDALGAGVAAVVTAAVAKVVKNKDARKEIRNFLDPDTLHSPF
jgi:hypothetical protein